MQRVNSWEKRHDALQANKHSAWAMVSSQAPAARGQFVVDHVWLAMDTILWESELCQSSDNQHRHCVLAEI